MAAKETLRQRAYRHIHAKLLSGELVAGQVISAATLSVELGFSRMPVQQAIQDLEFEGILQQLPRYGTVVRNLGPDDLVDLFELRDAIEPFSVMRVAGRLNAEDQASLRLLVEECRKIADEMRASDLTMTNDELMQRQVSADYAFHWMLLNRSGNRQFVDVISHARALERIFRAPGRVPGLPMFEPLERIDQIYEQHGRILDAVCAGNAEEACQAMRDHIRFNMRHYMEYMRRRSADPSTDFPPVVLDTLLRVEQNHGSKNGRTRAVKKDSRSGRR